jgi:hypothetical protein
MNQPEPPPQPGQRLRLRRFDIAQIGPGSAVLIFGMRNTGKSKMAQSILRRCSSITDIHLVTNMELHPNIGYRAHFPNVTVYNELPTQFHQRGPTAVVIDDSRYDHCFMARHTDIRDLIVSRRQTASLFILTQLYAHALPQVLRNNCDYMIVLGPHSHTTSRLIHERYASFVPTAGLFFQILRAATADECGLVVLRSPEMNDVPWQERLLWCRPPSFP